MLNKKILVTGGAGFIGSAIVSRLNGMGIKNIIVSDILGRDEKWKNLAPLKYLDYVEAGRLADRLAANPNLLGDMGVSTVFHLGACSSTTESDASFLVENNYEWTKTLCECALGAGARFVYASSAATYGDGSNGMDDSCDIEKLRPLNMYGYSKQMFDLYAKHAGFANDIVGVKYFNVYGPNENHKGDMKSLVFKATHQILETGAVKLFKSCNAEYADGRQMRDFLYVKDAVDMTIHLAACKNAGGLYNIGSGQAHTWIELAENIFKAMGKKPSIEFIDMPEWLRGKYQYYTCADISKLRATGYEKPVTPFEDAIRDYVQNYILPDRRLEPGE